MVGAGYGGTLFAGLFLTGETVCAILRPGQLFAERGPSSEALRGTTRRDRNASSPAFLYVQPGRIPVVGGIGRYV